MSDTVNRTMLVIGEEGSRYIANPADTDMLTSFNQMSVSVFEQTTVSLLIEPKVSYITHVIMGSILLVFGIFGAFGNAVIMVIFFRSRRRNTSANMLIANLSFADFAMSICNPLVSASSYKGYWLFGEAGCASYTIAVGTTGLVSITTMAAIAVDRYIVIARLTGDWGRMTGSGSVLKTRFVIAALWTYSLMWNIFPLCGWGGYALEEYGTACSFEYLTQDFNTQSYVLSIFIGGFALPLLFLFSCYGFIFWDVWRHEQVMAEVARESNTRTVRHSRSPKPEIQLAKVSLTIVVFFCIAWIPYAVITLYGTFVKSANIPITVQILPAIFAKSSPIYNPVIYGCGHPVVRKAWRRLSRNSGSKDNKTDKTFSLMKSTKIPGKHSMDSEFNAPSRRSIRLKSLNRGTAEVRNLRSTSVFVNKPLLPKNGDTFTCEIEHNNDHHHVML